MQAFSINCISLSRRIGCESCGESKILYIKCALCTDVSSQYCAACFSDFKSAFSPSPKGKSVSSYTFYMVLNFAHITLKKNAIRPNFISSLSVAITRGKYSVSVQYCTNFAISPLLFIFFSENSSWFRTFPMEGRISSAPKVASFDTSPFVYNSNK